MIRTENEYRLTSERVSALRQALTNEELQLHEEGLNEEEVKRTLDPMRSFALGLEEELERYKRLQRGDIRAVGEIHLTTLGQTLIAIRILARISQRELATRLKVHESRISHWERNEYHGIRIEHASKVLDALGVRTRTIFDIAPTRKETV